MPPYQVPSIIMYISSAADQIYGRFLKLWQIMKRSENDRVNYLTHLCMPSARSIIGSKPQDCR